MSVPEPPVLVAEDRVVLHQVAARRGVALPLPAPGASAALWGGIALGLAPGVAMLVGGRPDLPPDQAAVVEQTGGFLRMRVAGLAAAEVLARGCRLDLDEAAFTPGSVARALIAQVTVILYRPTATRFELLVPATLARSFVHFLSTAAAPFGGVVLPAERGTR